MPFCCFAFFLFCFFAFLLFCFFAFFAFFLFCFFAFLHFCFFAFLLFCFLPEWFAILAAASAVAGVVCDSGGGERSGRLTPMCFLVLSLIPMRTLRNKFLLGKKPDPM